MWKYIFFFLLVLLFLVILKLVLWSIPITDTILNWKYLGKLPTGANVPQPIPIDCIDSGKNMSSTGCANHSTMVVNEYQISEKLIFS